jgi:cholesterol oxidase
MEAEHFDAVVVGSGFGGSVTAYRLAEGGLDVCVLERGRAYPPGSFPDTPAEMARNFWDPSEELFGLYDLWSFTGIEALVSSGLGGGSLIYANVLLRKDERWFVDEDPDGGGSRPWPVTRADLDPHYDRVEAMIKPQFYPLDHPPYDRTAKARAFAAAAERVGAKAELAPLAITFAKEGQPPLPGERFAEPESNLHNAPRYTCRLVGECDIGCNAGAKNTLDFTYLSAANDLRAEIRTESDVRSFEPLDGGGYTVRYVTHPEGEERELSAKRVVVSAGTLGSTFLLLKMKEAGTLPNLSDRLGSRFCGNGDLLTFAIGTETRTDPSFGPVITSAIRYPDELDGEGASGRGFYIEDAGIPGFVPWLVQSADAPGALSRALKVLALVVRQRIGGDPESNLSAEAAGVLGDGRLSAHFLPLLGMGRDIPDGKMSLTKRGYLDVDWRTKKSGPYFDRLRAESRRLAEAMGAKFEDNLLWLLRRVITVHPLGGCPMGLTAEEGVVNPTGEVFGHPGLHVADGSVMPGPVGPNPSLTIAALADRFADAILEAEGRGGRAVAPEPARAPAATAPTSAPPPPARSEAGNGAPVAVSFTEEMKGFVGLGERDFDRGYRTGRERRTPLMFHLTITAADIDAFIANPEHEAVAKGWVECEALGGRLPVERGVFNLFVDAKGERRSKRMLYRLHFRNGDDRPLTLTGFKVVEDDPGFDVWEDTTTLFTRVLPGHVDVSPLDEPGEVLGAGIIKIRPLDFARQLTTFRADPGHRLDALARFGGLFAGDLWEVYLRRAERAEEERR